MMPKEVHIPTDVVRACWRAFIHGYRIEEIAAVSGLDRDTVIDLLDPGKFSRLQLTAYEVKVFKRIDRLFADLPVPDHACGCYVSPACEVHEIGAV